MDVAIGTMARVCGCTGAHLWRSAPPGDERGCTVSCERRRRPSDALIKRDVGLGLAEEVPVMHRRGHIGPGGWVSCAEAANDQTRMVWAGPQAEQDSAAQGRAGAIGDGRGGSPIWARIRSTGAASVIKAMMRMSTPQLGQTSSSDSNSRANSMAQRWRAGERAFGAVRGDLIAGTRIVGCMTSIRGGRCPQGRVGCAPAVLAMPVLGARCHAQTESVPSLPCKVVGRGSRAAASSSMGIA